MKNPRVRIINLNEHPKLHATLAKMAETQRKRAATRAKNQVEKS